MTGSSPEELRPPGEDPLHAAAGTSPERELWELARAVRAHLEWQRSTGARALPRDPNPVLPLSGGAEVPAAAARVPSAAAFPSAPTVPTSIPAVSRQAMPVAAAPAAAGPAQAKPLPVSSDTRASEAREAPPSPRSPAVVPGAPAGPGVPGSPPARTPSAPARVGSVAGGVLASGLGPGSVGENRAAESSVTPAVLAPVTGDAKLRLQVLAEQAQACTRCGLHATRKQAVFARGNGSSGLCFVGEGPGADEDAQGFPFVGAAGQLLDKMIGAMGLSRDDVYVCNVVKCRPPNNRKPEPEEMAACLPFLQQQLEILEPRVIVALGATAVQGMLGTTEGITRLRGKWKLYRGEIPVMPTFHPAYLLRTPSAKREVWEDLQAVVRQMGRSLPERS